MSDIVENYLIVHLEAARKNEENFGRLKFDICKWPKRKIPRYTNCKFNLRVFDGSLTYENGLVGKRNTLINLFT